MCPLLQMWVFQYLLSSVGLVKAGRLKLSKLREKE